LLTLGVLMGFGVLVRLGVLGMPRVFTTFVVATMLAAKLLSRPVILRWPAQPALEG
jgi:hypothetical protein